MLDHRKKDIGPSRIIKMFDQILPYLRSPPYENSVNTKSKFLKKLFSMLEYLLNSLSNSIRYKYH